ncbi:hypothetical protein B0H14DRAFT_3430902 [Mycena olivaceomarginata]|nr:hypothetical protein B0H14DRAFT_3430902 [Mycena olivaceomarginata]
MSGTLTNTQQKEVNFELGPWFVNYFTWYNDKKPLKIIVGVLVLLTLLKSIQALCCDHMDHVHRPLWWRLWVISKKWYVVAPIAVLFLFAFLSIVVATYYITVEQNDPIKEWFAAHLGSVFAGDIILSLTTAYFLLTSRKDVLPQTAGLINGLIRLTFQTAAPAALCAMFNLIFSQISVTDVDSIVSTAFNMPLPKLYAVSMMWTLNARRAITAYPSSEHEMTGTSNEISGARSRAQRHNNDVELGAIQVVTQTETHIDVRDMFDQRRGRDNTDHKGGANYMDTEKSDDESSVRFNAK